VFLDESIPKRVRDFIYDAIGSQPAGAVTSLSSAIDAIMVDKKFPEEGRNDSLRNRIDRAKKAGLLTDGMKSWAHKVRSTANIPRHLKREDPIPTEDEKQMSLEFTLALTEFLYVLPAKVKAGMKPRKSSSPGVPEDNQGKVHE
jgi:hypothetical protein